MQTVFAIIVGLFFWSYSSLSQVRLLEERCLTTNAHDDRFASYSPKGDQIIFESNRDGHWAVYLMDADGNNIRKLTKGEGDFRRPTWHPTGRKILFESDKNGIHSLEIINLQTGKMLTLAPAPGELIFANFSPNGEWIAASIKETEDKSNILLLNRKGKLIDQLTDNEYRNYYPKWSTDGSEIVFFSRVDTDNEDDEIYRLNIKTKVQTRLTSWHKHNFCPSWSADGRKIVYVTSMIDTRPEIYVMDRNGQNQIRLTENEDGETLPNWHPTEDRILVTAFRNGNHEICELKVSFE